jgi:hypothetical protein
MLKQNQFIKYIKLRSQMNFYNSFKLLKPYSRGPGFLSLTIAMVILMVSTGFAQPVVPSHSLPDSAAINQPHKLMLIWNKATTADTYRLQVSVNSDFSTTVYDLSQLTDTVKFIDTLELSTTYFWRVSATYGSGTSDF